MDDADYKIRYRCDASVKRENRLVLNSNNMRKSLLFGDEFGRNHIESQQQSCKTEGKNQYVKQKGKISKVNKEDEKTVVFMT